MPALHVNDPTKMRDDVRTAQYAPRMEMGSQGRSKSILTLVQEHVNSRVG